MAAIEFLTADEARAIFREEIDRALAKIRPDEMLSIEEAAARLHLSECTVRRQVKSGRLPSTKVGAQYRIPASALRPPDDGEIVELAHAARFRKPAR